MNSNYIKLVVAGLLLLISMQDATAQFDVYFGHTGRYMFWPGPEPASSSVQSPIHSASKDYSNGVVLGVGPDPEHLICNPFNFTHAERDSARTIYGFALSGGPGYNGDPYTYEKCIWTESFDFDAYVYRIIDGDSIMEIIKDTTFHVNRGKRPDRRMIVSDSLVFSSNPAHSDRLATYLHEFYFDEPITITGEFLIAVQPSVKMIFGQFLLGYLSGSDQIQFCSPGYWGYIDIKNQHLVNYRANCGRNTYYGTTTFPDIEAENVRTLRSQVFYPILVPQGSVEVQGQNMGTAFLHLVPNPARTEVRVEAECAVRFVEVADMTGRTVLRWESPGGECGTVLDVSRLPRGCYAVRVGTALGVQAERLLLQ